MIFSNVITQTSPFYFTEDCLNDWQNLGIKDERNFRMGGLFRTSSGNGYQFIKNAAKILSHVLYTKGVSGKATLIVEVLKNFIYEEEYRCDINFGTAEDSRDTFSVEMLDTGISELIKNREDVEYEIPIWNNTKTLISTLRPMRVLGELNFLTGWPIPEQGNTTTSFSTDAFNYRIYILNASKTLSKVSRYPNAEPIALPLADKNSFVTGQRFMEATAGGTTSYPVGSQYNFLFKAIVDIKNVQFNTTIGFFIHNDSGANRIYRGRLWLIDAITGTYDPTWIYQVESPVLTNGVGTSFSLTFTPPLFDVPAGKALVMQFGFDAGSGPSDNTHNVAWEKDNRIQISFEHYTTSYDVQGIRIYDVFKQLLDKITDSKAVFSSSLLTKDVDYIDGVDLRMTDVILMSGDSVRGAEKAVLKITLKKLLKAVNVFCGAGLGIVGDRVVVEKMDYFYRIGQDNLIADLGEINDNSNIIQPAEEMIFNEVHIGFNPTEYKDDINGRDETHNTTKYTTPYTRDKNVLDLISPIKTDGYGIFDTWVNFSQSKNKSNDNDDTLFALQIVPTPYAFQGLIKKHYALYPSDITSNPLLTGILESANFPNPGLTPRRCLERNGFIIRSYFHGVDSEYLKFQTSERNQNLQSKLSGSKIWIENEDVLIGSLGNRLFYPYYLNPNVLSPENYRAIMDSNRYGYFKFKWRGIIHYGFPISVYSRNSLPKLHKFKLLVTSEANPQNWIR